MPHSLGLPRHGASAQRARGSDSDPNPHSHLARQTTRPRVALQALAHSRRHRHSVRVPAHGGVGLGKVSAPRIDRERGWGGDSASRSRHDGAVDVGESEAEENRRPRSHCAAEAGARVARALEGGPHASRTRERARAVGKRGGVGAKSVQGPRRSPQDPILAGRAASAEVAGGQHGHTLAGGG